jgi:hypothetical protein
MAERKAEIFGLPEEGAEPESVDVRRLPFLISGALTAQGNDRRAVATQINRVLIAMRRPGHEKAESGLLVAALDGHRFDDMVDEQGRDCRKEAVETLLACGFPHALNISPEDLAFAREWKPAPPDEDELDEASDWTTTRGWVHPLRRARGFAFIAILGGQLAFAWLLMFTAGLGGGIAPAFGAGLVAVVTAFLLAISKPDLESQAIHGTALVMMLVIQTLCATSIGVEGLLGPAAIAVGLLAAFGSQYTALRDPPKPGDWDYREPGD